MLRRVSGPLGRVALLAVAVSIAAPLAWAQKSAEKAAEDRLAFRKSVLAIRAQIDTTLGSLKGIVDAKDDNARKSALKKYGDNLKDMDKQIQKTKDYAKSMKERGQDYFKEWEKTMQSISNEALKASATERRAALQAQYQKIEGGIESAKKDSAGFWKNLQDLQKYYMNDASADAVAASASMVEAATTDGKKIQGYIDQVVAAVDQVGKKEPAPAPTTDTTQPKTDEAVPPEAAPEAAPTPEN